MVGWFEIAEVERMWQEYLGLFYTEVYNYRTSRTNEVKAMIKPNLAEAHWKAAFSLMNV
jgi:hypothetical protein